MGVRSRLPVPGALQFWWCPMLLRCHFQLQVISAATTGASVGSAGKKSPLRKAFFSRVCCTSLGPSEASEAANAAAAASEETAVLGALGSGGSLQHVETGDFAAWLQLVLPFHILPRQLTLLSSCSVSCLPAACQGCCLLCLAERPAPRHAWPWTCLREIGDPAHLTPLTRQWPGGLEAVLAATVKAEYCAQ